MCFAMFFSIKLHQISCSLAFWGAATVSSSLGSGTMASAHPTSNYVSHGAGSVGNDTSRLPLAERMAGWKRSSKAGSFSMYLRYLADLECEKCVYGGKKRRGLRMN